MRGNCNVAAWEGEEALWGQTFVEPICLNFDMSQHSVDKGRAPSGYGAGSSLGAFFQEFSMVLASTLSPSRSARSLQAWQSLPVALALVIGSWGLSAQAEVAHTPRAKHAMQAQGCHSMADGERMGAMHKSHLAAIKKQLSLTAEQDAAWTHWVESMTPADRLGRPDFKKADWAGLTTPQRLDKMQAMHEEHSQRMAQTLARHSEATKTFYAALTEAQQKIFDQVTLRHMMGRSRAR